TDENERKGGNVGEPCWKEKEKR
ncbi:hypothetical protein CCACVL1_29471, partial [Corchorus capsularis]